ncbi:MAG: hypothetical protein H0W25_03370, partial [Acidimicrobiia bacterium]|nr:hypothetical protein [Acidimicrobiia bacterium]
MQNAQLQVRAAALVLAAEVLLRRRGTTRTLQRLHRGGGRAGPVDPAAAMAAV